MVKKVFAVTDVKGSDVYVEAGEPLVTAQFTKAELKALMDVGAIEVREVEEEKPKEAGPDTMVTKPSEGENPPEE